jgi:hypothetical protein
MKPHETIEWIIKMSCLHYGVNWKDAIIKKSNMQPCRNARKVCVYLTSFYIDNLTSLQTFKVNMAHVDHASRFYYKNYRELSYIGRQVGILINNRLKQAA